MSRSAYAYRAHSRLVIVRHRLLGRQRKGVCVQEVPTERDLWHGWRFTFHEFPAFCRNKNHFVSISWTSEKHRSKPIRSDAGVPVFVCRSGRNIPLGIAGFTTRKQVCFGSPWISKQALSLKSRSLSRPALVPLIGARWWHCVSGVGSLENGRSSTFRYVFA